MDDKDYWLSERVKHYRERLGLPSERENRKRDLIASQLAKHFDTGRRIGPCACMAPKCFELGCARFWRAIIDMKPEHIERAFRAYFTATGGN